jgi:hypothetical protein
MFCKKNAISNIGRETKEEREEESEVWRQGEPRQLMMTHNRRTVLKTLLFFQ